MSHEDVFKALKRHIGGDGPGVDIYRSPEYMTIYNDLQDRIGSKRLEDELTRARKLFQKYDTDRSGYLERHELSPIIKDSYRLLGKDVNPSQEEIDQYLRMMDVTGDNQVSMEEFELHILKSLLHRNLHL